jgi:hypothetical protein
MLSSVLGRKISKDELEDVMERPACELLYEMLSNSPYMKALSYGLCRYIEDTAGCLQLRKDSDGAAG